MATRRIIIIGQEKQQCRFCFAFFLPAEPSQYCSDACKQKAAEERRIATERFEHELQELQSVMKPVQKMTDAELEKEVTELRNQERALRKARRTDDAKALGKRITELALEQGRRER